MRRLLFQHITGARVEAFFAWSGTAVWAADLAGVGALDGILASHAAPLFRSLTTVRSDTFRRSAMTRADIRLSVR